MSSRCIFSLPAFPAGVQAARDMGISYAKAHRILRDLEKNAGRRIIVTHIGGPDGGGAELKLFARTLVAAYEQFFEDVKEVSVSNLLKSCSQ